MKCDGKVTIIKLQFNTTHIYYILRILLLKARKRKKMASEKHKQIHHDLLFMNNFVNQTCSLSKSFLRYDLKNQNNYLKMKKTVAVKKLQVRKK